MRQSIAGIIASILNKRFSYLFFTIILLFLVRPFVERATTVNTATNIFFWFIIVSCVWAVHEKRKNQWFVTIAASAAILTGLLDFFLKNVVTSWASKITIVLFLGYAVSVILFYLFRQKRVSSDLIMAAASEYVLIGILWTFLFYILEGVYPGSFSFQGSEINPAGFLYYSFVTLTTTGYGDVLPVSAQARSLAMLEMITGQLFIAITVARLVGLYTADGNKR